MLVAAATIWSCAPDAAGPTAPAADPGFLTVEWTAAPAAADIGVLLELEGPGIETVRAPGYELYRSADTGPLRIVVAGPLRSGPLLRFRVPDRNLSPLYRVRVIEITGDDYTLRDPGAYRAAIAR